MAPLLGVASNVLQVVTVCSLVRTGREEVVGVGCLSFVDGGGR
jgi:hypothetical protein